MDINLLATMVKDGKNAKEIADAFGVKIGSVYSALSRAGISICNHRTRAIADYSAIHGCKAAAEHFGVRLNYVYATRGYHGNTNARD